jgi:hypothetical protein
LTVHKATPVALYGGGGRMCTTNGGCRSDEPCRGEAVFGAAELGGRGESTGAARRVGWLGGGGGTERTSSTLIIFCLARHDERASLSDVRSRPCANLAGVRAACLGSPSPEWAAVPHVPALLQRLAACGGCHTTHDTSHVRRVAVGPFAVPCAVRMLGIFAFISLCLFAPCRSRLLAESVA